MGRLTVRVPCFATARRAIMLFTSLGQRNCRKERPRIKPDTTAASIAWQVLRSDDERSNRFQWNVSHQSSQVRRCSFTASMTSRVRGSRRMRMPQASKTAFTIAAATGTDPGSPWYKNSGWSRMWRLHQKRYGRNQHSADAIPALHSVLFYKSELNGMESHA